MSIPTTPTRTPATLITGFLGAGKTTFINALLSYKDDERWGILVNEFGNIGIDGSLFDTKDIDIQEVSGGCICCNSQLPMQVALLQLLKHQPTHLIIEPTGLAHADELIEQFELPHWQNTLRLNAVICILNASQWQQEQYRTHTSYQMHIKYADIIIVSRADTLNDDDYQQMMSWADTINNTTKIIKFADDACLLDLLHTPRKAQQPHTNPLSIRPPSQMASQHTNDGTSLPYRYHERMSGYEVGGWRLPKSWRFDSYRLQKWLLNLPSYARIKGIMHTDEGWLSLNITPESITISPTTKRDDGKLELILTNTVCWESLDDELMAFIL
ncbi:MULTISPECIES: GTP-binding protein [unclassified Moraxella]|uniref:CobW family GTP-binding protein n=1 Tax=unclassified Moraxella TaxID=2685852 RepID=UPI00359F1227